VVRTKNQESAKISMGHLVKRDTCFSRPQAKRVGGAPAIRLLNDKRADRWTWRPMPTETLVPTRQLTPHRRNQNGLTEMVPFCPNLHSQLILNATKVATTSMGCGAFVRDLLPRVFLPMMECPACCGHTGVVSPIYFLLLNH
jgi:hypothetical protein